MNGSSGAFASRFGAGVSAGCSAAAADGVVALSFDLDRAGGSAGTAGGVAEELRPLVGLGATMTSMGGVIGFVFDLSLVVGLVSADGTVVVSAAALDELDAAPGVREALLLLALAFAAGGGAEASLLAARGFAALASAAAAAAASRFGTEAARFAALGTEAARGGVSFSGVGSGSIFDRDPNRASSVACFILRRCASLNNVGSGLLNLLALILPLPGGGGGPPGGGAMPAGVSGGPGCMCSINSLAFRLLSAAVPTTFAPYGDFRTATVFTAFPPVAFAPLTLAIIGSAPESGGPGGCCQPGANTGSAGMLFGCGIAWFTRLSTYDWSIDAAPDGPM